MEKRGTVLFLGAGISAPHPASGPLFGTVREALLRRIGVSATSTAAEALVEQTLPEVFLKLMNDAGLTLGKPLAEAVTGDLAVTGSQVGDSRLAGGWPPSAEWRR